MDRVTHKFQHRSVPCEFHDVRPREYYGYLWFSRARGRTFHWLIDKRIDFLAADDQAARLHVMNRIDELIREDDEREAAYRARERAQIQREKRIKANAVLARARAAAMSEAERVRQNQGCCVSCGLPCERCGGSIR